MPPLWWYAELYEHEPSEDDRVSDMPDLIEMETDPFLWNGAYIRDYTLHPHPFMWPVMFPFDDDRTTCNSSTEHDLTDMSDTSEWEHDSNILDAFNCTQNERNMLALETTLHANGTDRAMPCLMDNSAASHWNVLNWLPNPWRALRDCLCVAVAWLLR